MDSDKAVAAAGVTVLGAVGVVLMTFISLAFSLLSGWVVSVLWSWFVLPSFPGVPPISVRTAVGIGMILCLLRPNPIRERKPDEESGAYAAFALAGMITGPMITLAVGWLLLRLIPA